MKRKRSSDSSDANDSRSPSTRPRKRTPKSGNKRAKSSASKNAKTSRANDSSTRKMKRSESSTKGRSSTKKKRRMEDTGGVKWTALKHSGPLFAPAYKRLPSDIHFRYNGKVLKLSKDAEEIGAFYAQMLNHEFTKKPEFNKNFFEDWREAMTKKEREIIQDLKKCDFTKVHEFYLRQSEARKNLTPKEKQKAKRLKELEAETYGKCLLNGKKEKVGNYRVEPPGLFRGRGDHPKMGRVKKRVLPEDVIINCSKGGRYCPSPPKGHAWKDVIHDNSVSWLACWNDQLQGSRKYILLNPASTLKGESDQKKYEKARELGKQIKKIRAKYKRDWKSEDMKVKQRGVALYFIDQLALRAGNEKGDDKADTVGCCNLRVEHIRVGGGHNKPSLTLDFPGKDSIRYFNKVSVDKQVWKNLREFLRNKDRRDELFDLLTPSMLNKHLNEVMNGLTAKVFRTYNASRTLQETLDKLTPAHGSIEEKMLAYNRANREVALLCNHQKTVPKNFKDSMKKLDTKIKAKKSEVTKAKKELKKWRKGTGQYAKKRLAVEVREKQLKKLLLTKTDRMEGKNVALGTSKLNYLDPRISVEWSRRHEVPIQKIYSKTQRDKFRWALEMDEADFRF